VAFKFYLLFLQPSYVTNKELEYYYTALLTKPDKPDAVHKFNRIVTVVKACYTMLSLSNQQLAYTLLYLFMVVAHFEKFTTGHCSQHLPGLQRKGNQ
jgi:hypothetical protein